MSIGITGSSGFVGKNLQSYLRSFDYSFSTIDRGTLKSINHSSLNEYHTIIHLAGKAHDLKNISNSNEYYEVNFNITQNLYDQFLKSSAKNFIYISSVKAAADCLDEELTESYSPNPSTHYGKSKLMAEQYIQSRELPDGKSHYILRPCMIHGPGNKGNLNLLYQFVSKRLPYPLAGFENSRSFLSIENLCFVIKEIIERENIPSGIYNVADDDFLSTKEVVALLSEASHRPPRLWRIPTPFIKFIAKMGSIFNLSFNSERLHKLTENYIVSNKKIKNVIQKELPLSIREGILRTARSFKDA